MDSKTSEKTKIYNYLQAKTHAKTYYELGNSLYESLLPSLTKQKPTNEVCWKLWPAFVNISFACEIILKLFYESDHATIAHGHNLYDDLFVNLSCETQNLISDKTIDIMKNQEFNNYDKMQFIKDLKESANTFKCERYSFEMTPGTTHRLKCEFLLSFSKALLILSGEII